MSKLSLSLALMLSLAGTIADAGPMQPAMYNTLPRSLVVQAGCDGGDAPLKNGSRHVRRQGNCDPNAEGSSSGNDRRIINRRIVDCHRSVRTHRVGGIMLKHRHVGDNCAIREVYTSN